MDLITMSLSNLAGGTVKTFARCGIGPQGVVAVEDTSRNGDLFPPEARDPKKVLDMPAAPAKGKE